MDAIVFKAEWPARRVSNIKQEASSKTNKCQAVHVGAKVSNVNISNGCNVNHRVLRNLRCKRSILRFRKFHMKLRCFTTTNKTQNEIRCARFERPEIGAFKCRRRSSKFVLTSSNRRRKPERVLEMLGWASTHVDKFLSERTQIHSGIIKTQSMRALKSFSSLQTTLQRGQDGKSSVLPIKDATREEKKKILIAGTERKCGAKSVIGYFSLRVVETFLRIQLRCLKGFRTSKSLNRVFFVVSVKAMSMTQFRFDWRAYWNRFHQLLDVFGFVSRWVKRRTLNGQNEEANIERAELRSFRVDLTEFENFWIDHKSMWKALIGILIRGGVDWTLKTWLMAWLTAVWWVCNWEVWKLIETHSKATPEVKNW